MREQAEKDAPPWFMRCPWCKRTFQAMASDPKDYEYCPLCYGSFSFCKPVRVASPEPQPPPPHAQVPYCRCWQDVTMCLLHRPVPAPASPRPQGDPQSALCAECGNPQDEHGGPLYAHRYVAPQPAPAESPWTVADEALQPEPPASPRPQGEPAHLGLCPCGHPEDYHRPGPGARVCAFGWPVAANRCNCLGWRTTSEPDVESAALLVAKREAAALREIHAQSGQELLDFSQENAALRERLKLAEQMAEAGEALEGRFGNSPGPFWGGTMAGMGEPTPTPEEVTARDLAKAALVAAYRHAHPVSVYLERREVIDAAGRAVLSVLQPLLRAAQDSVSRARDMEWWEAVVLVDNVAPGPEAAKNWLAALSAHEQEQAREEATLAADAEWLQHANRYFEGIQDTAKLLRDFDGNLPAAVIHEIWKRDPNVQEATRAAEAKAYREAAEMADVACSDVEADARKDYLAARDSGDERMQHFNSGREVGAGECREAIEARARLLAEPGGE